MVIPLNNKERFEQNLERFSYFSPDDAKIIPSKISKKYAFFLNNNGELNLKIKQNNEERTLYSSTSIQEEAKSWFSKLSLENVKILYVFGVGLGTYYEAAKEWLSKSNSHFLFFLEDDVHIISLFLQTDLATEILHHRQVRLQYIDKDSTENGKGVEELMTAFLFDPYKISALKYYEETRLRIYEGISRYFSQQIYSKQSLVGEFLLGSFPFFSNFYQNLQYLEESYFANGLFAQFKNVPAIICGAGPSLEKNIHLLKTLSDKALIIAGGTATNALNSYDVFPHFTAGIDPNPSQLIRILANNAYETPIFYRTRIYKDALKINSGPKLYVSGSGGYNIPDFIEKKLGIEGGKPVDEGYNVVNFCVSVAQRMGCNPIILCGLDLSYTHNKSYLTGIKFHALHNFKRSFITKGNQDELIGFKDINGQSTSTLWKWVNESNWFSFFKENHPKEILINATEGGIGFANIPHMTLKNAEELYLKKTYDFESMVHGEIQNSAFSERVSSKNISSILSHLRKSLGECESLLKQLINECSLISRNRFLDVKVPIEPGLEKIEKLQESLLKEDYYNSVLKRASQQYFRAFEKRLSYFTYDFEKGNEEQQTLSKIELHLGSYKFLDTTLKSNKKLLDLSIKNFHKIIKNQKIKKNKKHLEKNEKILNQSKNSDQGEEEEYLSYFSNGEVKSRQIVKEGLLQGASTYYSKEGILLAKCFYEKGFREGKAFFYYATGALYAEKNFKKGVLEGLQLYYFEGGAIKSKIPFKYGKLDGRVLLYYENNRLKREINFRAGKREGSEKMWNKEGGLLIEAEYLDDHPIGISNWWYESGQLKQKVIHSENLEEYEIECYEENGEKIPQVVVEGEDYFDHLMKITNTIMQSMEGVFEKIQVILPHLNQSSASEILERKENIEKLKLELNKLSQINEQIRHDFNGSSHNLVEPIWKSSALKEQIEKELKGVTELMSKELQVMENLVKELLEKRK